MARRLLVQHDLGHLVWFLAAHCTRLVYAFLQIQGESKFHFPPPRSSAACPRSQNTPNLNTIPIARSGSVQQIVSGMLRPRWVPCLRRPRPCTEHSAPRRGRVFQASVGHRSLIHMVHYFTILGSAASGLSLRQRWVATGVLVPGLWPFLRFAMARFREFGTDLSARVSAIRPGIV